MSDTNFNLLWRVPGRAKGNSLITVLSDVLPVVQRVCLEYGYVQLERFPWLGESSRLTLHSERGRHLLLLGACDETRTLFDSTGKNVMVDVMGDFWDERITTCDSNVVSKAFTEFFETGDVKAMT